MENYENKNEDAAVDAHNENLESDSNATQMDLTWTSPSTSDSYQSDISYEVIENASEISKPSLKRKAQDEFGEYVKFDMIPMNEIKKENPVEDTMASITEKYLIFEMENYPASIQRKIRRRVIAILDEISSEVND